MNYLDAWREGHKAGMTLTIKIINDMCGTEFQDPGDVVLHIKSCDEPQIVIKEVIKEVIREVPVQTQEGLTKKEKQLNQDLAQRIAQQQWLMT